MAQPIARLDTAPALKTNLKLSRVTISYRKALEAHLKNWRSRNFESAHAAGRRAAAAGLHSIDLAKIHEQVLVTTVLPPLSARAKASIIKRAGLFLSAAITHGSECPANASEAKRVLKRAIDALSVRTVELAASNRELNVEIEQRRIAEASLLRSEKHYAESLERSRLLQEQMRALSRQLLSAHEDERRRISRELHDVVAQTLTGINIRLATLRTGSAGASKALDRNIAKTQRLVEHSVTIVHQFARELRPTVLDDLGLIPALHSYLKSFTIRTGIHARLTAFAAVEKLDIGRRTVLFRVAQEALTNVARHSGASQVEVCIEQLPKQVRMRIKDDGKSFDPAATLQRVAGKRLGLLGMKERVEMVGGSFAVHSIPGHGATITAEISIRNRGSKH
jgi:signal transduction histidine kinase